MNYALEFYKAKSFCSQLGGVMPLPDSETNFKIRFGNNLTSILPEECNSIFWMPIVKSKKNLTQWIDARKVDKQSEVKYLPWAYGQPNGLIIILIN
jgi:hypothetical protein